MVPHGDAYQVIDYSLHSQCYSHIQLESWEYSAQLVGMKKVSVRLVERRLTPDQELTIITQEQLKQLEINTSGFTERLLNYAECWV